MCTIAFSFLPQGRWPLVVAANRDERLGRPSRGWALREPAQGPRFAAPRDLLAGGTWIGVSGYGLFAALTNRRSGAGSATRRSRGELVDRALRYRDAAEARAELARGELFCPANYNGFHLVVADAKQAFLLCHDGETAQFEDLEPGLHVVSESVQEDRGPRGERVRARWPIDLDLASLRQVLVLHGPGATCIHDDPFYGTRSATVLRLARSLPASELYVSEDRPCTSPLEDRSELLRSLAAASS